jgi:hypothetical protein
MQCALQVHAGLGEVSQSLEHHSVTRVRNWVIHPERQRLAIVLLGLRGFFQYFASIS